jgi:hypothetical protein
MPAAIPASPQPRTVTANTPTTTLKATARTAAIAGVRVSRFA